MDLADITWVVFLGGSALIVLGIILYRSRFEIGSKGARSIGQWIWYITVAIIAWFVILSLLRPGV